MEGRGGDLSHHLLFGNNPPGVEAAAESVGRYLCDYNVYQARVKAKASIVNHASRHLLAEGNPPPTIADGSVTDSGFPRV